MPPTENQGSFLGRISIRRNQVTAMEGTTHDQESEDIEIFQKNISDRFTDLFPPQNTDPQPNTSRNLLSIAWVRKLLDAFLCCEAEFKAVLIMGRDPTQIAKPPLDRLIPELLDRSVKALDICNAVTNGVESIRYSQKLAEIAVQAFNQKPLCEGQVRRAKKALNLLTSSMAESSHSKFAERTRSFGRRGSAGESKDRQGTNFRSLSWNVSKNWSASKQIQAMMSNLVAPRGVESSSLALPVYIMSTVMVFVMWALVALVPCQERSGLATHFPVPRQLNWAQGMVALQERIGEEWKKKEKKGSAGLLEEIQRMEKLGHSLVEFAEGFQFPAEEERAEEVAEMAEICGRMEEGLGPLQQQIREVFHRIVRSRTEILDLLDQVGKQSTPVM